MTKPFTYDHDYHIHSFLSTCSSDPEQSPENILRVARENGLHELCITDHFWDERVGSPSVWYAPQDYAHVSGILPLPQEKGIAFRFGCETDLDRNLRLGISRERMAAFDFIIISTTHLHMEGFTIFPEDAASDDRRAALWAQRLECVLDMDLPFHKIGIAHLTCPLLAGGGKVPFERHVKILDKVPDETLRRLFAKAAEKGAGIELNISVSAYDERQRESVCRIYRHAKNAGCGFYFGSDAHHLKNFEKARANCDGIAALLGLTEADRFYI